MYYVQLDLSATRNHRKQETSRSAGRRGAPCRTRGKDPVVGAGTYLVAAFHAAPEFALVHDVLDAVAMHCHVLRPRRPPRMHGMMHAVSLTLRYPPRLAPAPSGRRHSSASRWKAVNVIFSIHWTSYTRKYVLLGKVETRAGSALLHSVRSLSSYSWNGSDGHSEIRRQCNATCNQGVHTMLLLAKQG